jgi:hypothetical protein
MATGRRGSKHTRGKKSAPARKKARKVKPKARAKAGKAKARPRPRKPAKKARKRSRATRPVSKRVRSAPLAKVVAMRGAPAMAAGDDMAAKVEHELQVQGHGQPDPTVVATLAALCRGVSEESSGPPDWLNLDGDALIAAGIVARFITGENPNDADRAPHRPPVRGMVGSELQQQGGGGAGETERDVLTSFCLGTWNPNMNPHSLVNVLPRFAVRWYLAGHV